MIFGFSEFQPFLPFQPFIQLPSIKCFVKNTWLESTIHELKTDIHPHPKVHKNVKVTRFPILKFRKLSKDSNLLKPFLRTFQNVSFIDSMQKTNFLLLLLNPVTAQYFLITY